MTEYEAAFTRLEQFAQVFDTEMHRAKGFVEGLNPALWSRVLGYQCPTLVDAVELAAWYEDDHKLFLEERPKRKGKIFTPRPYAPGGPSSGSSGSSGKKRKECSDSVAEEGHSVAGRGSTGHSQIGSSSWPRSCFNCGKPGHLVVHCPKWRQSLDHVRCYNCGKAGHY